MFNLPKLEGADFSDKKVLLRADLDVPLIVSSDSSVISDDLRLKSSLETINSLGKASRIIICGHLGRPAEVKIMAGKPKESLSLQIVAQWYGKEFGNTPIKTKFGNFDSWEIGDKIVLLENLRFSGGEESNDSKFAKELASLADIYVNDAFGSSHRAHASIVGVPALLSHFAGLHLQKEVEELSKILENPKRPLTIIVGGAKIETKLPIISKMHHFADFVLVGGELAEHDRELISVQHEKTEEKKSAVLVSDTIENGKDITPHSIENFIQIIEKSETVVWNGPLGVIEEEDFEKGTLQVASAIANSNSYSIVGGGDLTGFLNRKELLSKFSFVSTGGGAMLEFLSGESLPGLQALSVQF